MIIEVALNSPYTDFTINENKIMSNNSELIVSAVKETGKVIVKVNYPETIQFLYLYIFKKRDNTNEIQALYNYVFRYLNVEKEDEFKKYTIFNGKSEISYEESNTENGDLTIKCTFNRLNISYDKANITYFFKVVENKSLIYGESCETIAFTQSPYYTVYKRNPSYDNDGKITLTATGKLSNWACLQIIAQIQQDTILEYVSYKGKEFIRPPEEDETSSSNYMALIVVMIILIVLVIGLALLVFIIQQKNKGLSEQVKHISFQQSQNANQAPNADPSLLLKK